MGKGEEKGSAGEDRLGEVRRELEEKVEELARANVELYEAARSKSEFVANMSHELRTPLNSIIGFADVLLGQMRGTASEEQVRYLQNIRQGGYRLLELVSEILHFERLESGQVRVNKGPVSVEHLVQEVVVSLSGAGTGGVEVSAEVEGGMPTVISDEVKLGQILRNLGSNAVKFTPEGGRVVLGARLRGERLEMWVSDTGVGVSEEEKQVIFKRFRQADGGITRRFEGVGLGLYIVAALVELLGGKIEVESEKGRGSVFRVEIPVETLEV